MTELLLKRLESRADLAESEDVKQKDDFQAGLAAGLRESIYEIRQLETSLAQGEVFQERVQPWMDACFGAEISADRVERNHRFLQEALELVQACGGARDECLQLVDYVFNRPTGEPSQEVGGVMVTLAALCLANSLDMHEAAEAELARVWTKIDAIRAKQAAKPRGSVLPISPSYAAAIPEGA